MLSRPSCFRDLSAKPVRSVAPAGWVHAGDPLRQAAQNHALNPPFTPRPAQPDGKRCLPLVNGCGCAYVCAQTFRIDVDGTHQVVHAFQDSRLDPRHH